jgi:hypothetical protein
MLSKNEIEKLGFVFGYNDLDYEVYVLELNGITLEITNTFEPKVQTLELGIARYFTNLRQMNFYDLKKLIELLKYSIESTQLQTRKYRDGDAC